MEEIKITDRDSIRHGKHCDGFYFIQPSFLNLSCWGRSFFFYKEYREALSKIKRLIKDYVNDERYSSLSESECRELKDEMDVTFAKYLPA